MDRSQFLLMAMLATAIGAVPLGCGRDTPGEYRTFAESQGKGEPAVDADVSVSRSTSEPTRDVGPSDTSDPLDSPDESASLLIDPTVPIEPEMTPEMTPEEETTGSNTDDSLAAEVVETVPAADDDPASAGTSADETAPPDERIPTPSPSDATASGTVPDPPDVTGPGVTDPGVTDPAAIDRTVKEPAAETSDAPIAARPIELLIPEQTFSPEGPEQALRVSYDDLDLLKVLNMEPVPEDAVSHFPNWLSRLDGERIRIRGFMYPTFQETGLPGFVLARDNEICCFGRSPKIYDLVEVRMRDGVTTDYIQGRPFDVIGVLHINPEADEGELYQLYQIDDAVVANK